MFGFVSLDDNSTVYREVAAQLTSQATGRGRDWRLLDKASTRFHLMLGPRNKLPYSRLGQVPGHTQLVNYYRGSSVICRKAALARTLRACRSESQQQQHGDQPPWPPWHPPTFIIHPRSTGATALQRLRAQSSSRKEDESSEFRSAHAQAAERGEGKSWVAKSTAGAKGEDIMISNDPEELLHFTSDRAQAFIIQKYIERPLLLPGNRKFDIRLWVLLDHHYDIFVFEEGVLRTASDPYEPSDLGKVTSHLTNHCLQEALSENYGKYEEGNEMFFEDFNRYLQSQHETNIQESLVPQMHAIVKDCLLAIKENVNVEGLSYASFQLFGFDFLVDADFKVWLLEVNGAPACASGLLEEMVSGLIHTAIDPLFPPSHPGPPPQHSFIKIS